MIRYSNKPWPENQKVDLVTSLLPDVAPYAFKSPRQTSIEATEQAQDFRIYFGHAGKLFDPTSSKTSNSAYTHRVEKFLNELVWMSRVLRYARENLPRS